MGLCAFAVVSRRVLQAAILAALVPLTACAEIRRFTVTPHEICPGTRVKTDWDITGSPTLTIRPDLKPESDKTYVPTTDTDFILAVRTAVKTATAPPNTVTLYTGTVSSPKAMVQPLTFSTRCVGNTVVAEETLSPADWDPRLTIAKITSGEGRDITITHEGKEATFTGHGDTSTALSGTKVVGAWKIAMPLTPAEKCSGANAPAGLDQIVLTPFLYCGS